MVFFLNHLKNRRLNKPFRDANGKVDWDAAMAQIPGSGGRLPPRLESPIFISNNGPLHTQEEFEQHWAEVQGRYREEQERAREIRREKKERKREERRRQVLADQNLMPGGGGIGGLPPMPVGRGGPGGWGPGAQMGGGGYMGWGAGAPGGMGGAQGQDEEYEDGGEDEEDGEEAEEGGQPVYPAGGGREGPGVNMGGRRGRR